MGSGFPRTVYRRSENGKFLFRNKDNRKGIPYDSMIVHNSEELEMATSDAPNMGYVDDFTKALFAEEEEVDVQEEEKEEGF